MIIDAHNHIGTRPGRSGQSAEDILAAMDAAGVDKAVVFPYIQNPNNEYVAAACQKHDRLIGFSIMNFSRKNVLDTFKHCLFDLGLKGLKLDTPIRGYNLTDFDLLDPVLSICNQYRLPVLAYGADDNPLTHPLRFGVLAKRYPGINFIMAHMGILFATSHAVEMAAQHKNVYLDISNANGSAVRDAIQTAGADKVLFATDTPFGFFEVTKLTVDLCTGDETERGLVYGGNMARILGQVTI